MSVKTVCKGYQQIAKVPLAMKMFKKSANLICCMLFSYTTDDFQVSGRMAPDQSSLMACKPTPYLGGHVFQQIKFI